MSPTRHAIVGPRIERQVAAIAREIVDRLPEGLERALAYAECEEGASGCDVFLQQGVQVRFAFGSEALTDQFHALWRAMRDEGHEPWRAAIFTIESPTGRFRLDHVYADRFDEEADPSDRREPHVQAYFGNLPIDYTPI